jgi:hypothetical protein
VIRFGEEIGRAPFMKRRRIFAILITVFVLALLILLLNLLVIDPTEPCFIPGSGNSIPGNYSFLHYDFLSPSPFEGGRMWVSVVWTNRLVHTFLLDIEGDSILGELVHARPVFFNRDQTKLLCSQRTPGATNALWRSLKDLPARIFNRPSHAFEDSETFWVIDLKGNSVTRLGRGYQASGAGSSFWPSPGFRYGFNKPTGSLHLPEILICDIEHNTFRKERVDGWPIGWWDDQRILFKDKNKDLVLYDVEARKTSAFLPLRTLQKSFVEAGLANDAGAANAFCMWNGQQNDFYLTEGDKRWSAEESYLIKIERPGQLKLLEPHFKFEWSDHFDASSTYYLYSGRERGQTNSAVYVRDLKTGKTRELIPPDPNRTNDFSLPNFYGTDVIYQRSNSLWRIRLGGSQNRRLFRPQAAP